MKRQCPWEGGQTDLDAARALLVQLVSSLPRLPFFVQQCSHFMRTVWNKAQCWTKKLTAPSVFKWGTLPDWEPHRGAVSLVTFNPGPFLCWELAGPWGPPDFHPCCGPRRADLDRCLGQKRGHSRFFESKHLLCFPSIV